ncbi:hypothetical protein SLS58_004588 [Diplodia intermedia]|uniref:DUF6594 domain-containing protein n=1 Tax=Diplodia intermedia TaxID=856260 RepID=A0ABR3TTR5_9PEZI
MTEKQVGSSVQDEETASSDASSLPSDPPAGYPKFAELMSAIPETAVFRRFGALNALNLLYLQAELIHIEQDLREVQLSDHRSQEGDKSLYAKNWFFLSVSEKDGDEEQIKLVERAREKLDKYNAALIQQKEILAMKGPSEFDRDFIRRFLASKNEGLNFALTGADLGVWGSVDQPKDCAKDLVALCPRHDEDRFSKWVTGKGITKFFHLGGARFRKRSPIHGFVGYEESDLLRITYNITTILASVLPIAAIAVLAYVQSMKAKLGIIAAFNVVLSVCLTVLTKAKRTDVFAVAAAFSAVQVVFVQSGMSGAGDGQ